MRSSKILGIRSFAMRHRCTNGAEVELEQSGYICGEYISNSRGTSVFTSINPANEQVICQLYETSPYDIARATQMAHLALHGPWKKISPGDRAKLLWKLADLVERDCQKLATIETLDSGKPIRATLEEDIPDVVNNFRFYAGLADKIHGSTIPVSNSKIAVSQ